MSGEKWNWTVGGGRGGEKKAKMYGDEGNGREGRPPGSKARLV